MGGYDVAQAAVPAGIEQGSRLAVGQVAADAADAALQPRRVRACSEQAGVMVALEQQRVAALQRLRHRSGRLAQIGQDADAVAAVAAGQLQWLGGVVRYREGLQRQRADDDGLAIARDPARGRVRKLGGGLGPGARTGPDRDAVATLQGQHAADMVAVLMGHEQRVEVADHQAAPGQAGGKLARRQAAVDEQARRPRVAAGRGLDQRGVAAAAAAQAGEAQHQGLFVLLCVV